ncbi:hypothetical protein WK09_19975 [Burkholderia ubonensis]|uniref:hypothetical protein n=1 Tax=Burkholderia ubonensis TaxID=101571 RepID=UPI000757EFD8|nr:hypothetical protein [Burkholderia ubonensis]KVQ87318.1 hypothetical protein WK09_19975 [Burkholderia ubonensis]KWB89904.1 hypothetical protein WL43_07340 [Burkholderia ubonensis]
MDTMNAFAMGQANRHKEAMVFDWDKAARLIIEHKATEAFAGLAGDWEYTGGQIFRNGEPYSDDYTYLSSTWATPELEIDGTTYACFRMRSEVPDWNSDTKWPASAMAILTSK